MDILTVAAYVGLTYVGLVFSWVLYIAIMGLARVRHDLHPVAKFNTYCIILPVGYFVDACILNPFFCLLVFHRIPRNWLLTGTLKRVKAVDTTWRYDAAAWICAHLLNQFDPKGKHC